jgi:hypothetical protein
MRPDSDIDLVLYGAVEESTLRRIWTVCDESALPVRVDVVAYASASPALRKHIDSVMQPLFSREELPETVPDTKKDIPL